MSSMIDSFFIFLYSFFWLRFIYLFYQHQCMGYNKNALFIFSVFLVSFMLVACSVDAPETEDLDGLDDPQPDTPEDIDEDRETEDDMDDPELDDIDQILDTLDEEELEDDELEIFG